MYLSIIYHERPGVYSDYTASSLHTARDAKVIALVGVSTATAGLYTVTACADGLTTFGAGSQLGKMLQAAYDNGAGTVLVYSIAADTTANYTTAIDAVLAEKRAAYCAVGSTAEAVQVSLAAKLGNAARQKGECIGVVSLASPTKAELLERAAALDCERMVLLGPGCYLPGESAPCAGGIAAAAFCGMLAAQDDPAMPLNGAVLNGISGVTARYEDTDVDALVQGGVTVLEADGGQVTVLRGITSRQTTGEGRDATYRELNTVLIIDEVVPGIRQALAARFHRAKNNEATRSAIRSQVVVELEDRRVREIIDEYSDVTVTAATEDPGICQVSFRFTVTHGLNRIYLTAHISV